jgi:hypothetical protein
VRSFADLQINPLRESQRRKSILAHAGSLAVGLRCLGNTVHQAESVSRPRRDVGNRTRPKTALGRLSDHSLVNLNRRQTGVERIALARGTGQLLIQVALDRTQARLDYLLDFAGLNLLRFLELALLIPQLADFIRVNALESLLQFVALLHQRDIGGAELFELRLLDRAIHIQQPGAIALDVEVHEFRRNLVFRFQFELECHNSRRLHFYTHFLAPGSSLHAPGFFALRHAAARRTTLPDAERSFLRK